MGQPQATAHDHHAHAAHDAALSVGGLEIDGGKIGHIFTFQIDCKNNKYLF